MSLQLAEQFEANEQYEQAHEEYKKELLEIEEKYKENIGEIGDELEYRKKEENS